MSLFKKVEEFKKMNEEAKKKSEEIRNTIFNLFVDSQYETKEVEADFDHSVGVRVGGETNNITVYYPILNLPEGFSKENESFFRKYSNVIIHKYTLKDVEGNQVDVECAATFNNFIRDDYKGKIRLRSSNIISKPVNYKITIYGEEYRFEREFDNKQMILSVVKDELKLRKDLAWCEESNTNEEKAYSSYINQLERTEDIPSLEELSKSSIEEIQINAIISAKLNISSRPVRENVILENDVIRVVAKDKNVYHMVRIRITPYIVSSGWSFEEKIFEFYQLQELEERVTLSEAMEMIR